ncbi:hypothetical protein HR51_35910 [Burkholderia cepacia]|nr:hypothetical protein HR51_35910 [Burkholderia cepacia]
MHRGPLRSSPDGATLLCYRHAGTMRLPARRRVDAKRPDGVVERPLDRGVPELGPPITQIANDLTSGRIAHVFERYEDRKSIQPRTC